jgi:repressor LexA
MEGMGNMELTADIVRTVRSRLKELGWTQAQLSKATGIAAPHITTLLKPGSTTSLETLGTLAQALGLPPADFFHGIATMPYRGAVAAGPFQVCEEVESGQRVDIRGRFPDGCFALRVSGNSCTGFGILDGELVAVRPTARPEEGRFVVARQGNGYTLKGYFDGRLYSWKPGRAEPELVPLDEETHIVGVVVQRLGDVAFRPAVVKLQRPKPKK